MHIGIIMDGNGRWATKRGLPRTAGHIEGAKAVRTTVEAAARAGVQTLTLYAFSAANWSRPPIEIAALMKLFGQYLFSETRRCVEQSIRVNIIGRRDRLSDNLLRSIEQSERLSASCGGMHLRVAVDYSSQYSILKAAERAQCRSAAAGEHGPGDLAPRDFERLLHEVDHSSQAAGPVDLLIRTGNERRLSDFLLWECAYAELYFSDCLWPEFDELQFNLALEDYAGRQRRFGGLTSQRGEEASRQVPAAGATPVR
jgi:undecaprenyl diphosphate synthase